MTDDERRAILIKQELDWPAHVIHGAERGNPFSTLCTHCYGRHRPPRNEICPREPLPKASPQCLYQRADAQREIGAVTDAGREEQIRQRDAAWNNRDPACLHDPVAEIDRTDLLRFLDEARARISEGEAIVIAQRLEITKARVEIQRLNKLLDKADEASLERAIIAQNEARAAMIEEAAKIADLYAERPPSGDHNNTRAAFDAGMDHRAGATDAAMCIADAIRALVADNKKPAEAG